MKNISEGGSAAITAEEKVVNLLLDHCHISELNTRQPTPKEVVELSKSIAEFGQTTPAIVRPHPTKGKGHYEIGAGSRRKVGCEVAKKEFLKSIVREMDDKTFSILVLVENLQREDPDPKEEARALAGLVAMGIDTPEKISAQLGKPKHWVERRMQLLKVDPKIRAMWEGKSNSHHDDITHFTVDMMELLGSLPRETQLTAIGNWQVVRSSTYKELNRAIQERIVCDLSKAPFDLNDPRFVAKDCGPGCATDSTKQPALFEFENKKCAGRCLNPTCFFGRMGMWRESEFQRLCKSAGVDSLPLVSKDWSPREILLGKNEVRPTSCQQVKSGKPKDGKGKLVIIVHDTGSLGLGHIPPNATGKAAKNVASPAQKLAERKDMLQGKRWGIVRESLRAAIAKSKAADCTESIEDLVAFFGLPRHQWPDREPVKGKGNYHEDAMWELFDAREKGGYPSMRLASWEAKKKEGFLPNRQEAMWDQFKEVLEHFIGGDNGQIGLLHRVHDMRRVAKLINFPIDLKKREADTQAPPPKTWGEVNIHTLEPLRKDDSKAPVKPKSKPKRNTKP